MKILSKYCHLLSLLISCLFHLNIYASPAEIINKCWCNPDSTLNLNRHNAEEPQPLTFQTTNQIEIALYTKSSQYQLDTVKPATYSNRNFRPKKLSGTYTRHPSASFISYNCLITAPLNTINIDSTITRLLLQDKTNTIHYPAMHKVDSTSGQYSKCYQSFIPHGTDHTWHLPTNCINTCSGTKATDCISPGRACSGLEHYRPSVFSLSPRRPNFPSSPSYLDRPKTVFVNRSADNRVWNNSKTAEMRGGVRVSTDVNCKMMQTTLKHQIYNTYSTEHSQKINKRTEHNHNLSDIAWLLLFLFCITVLALIHYKSSRQLLIRNNLLEKESKIQTDQLTFVSQLHTAELQELHITKLKEEQIRMAMELHDDVGAGLACLLVSLRSLLEKTDQGTLKKEIQQLETMGANLYDTVREKSHRWYNMPAETPDFSIADSIHSLLDTCVPGNTYEKEIMVDKDSLNKISMPVKIELMHILHEVIANIAKHAAANKITILIYEDLPGLIIIVSDNGKGFKQFPEHREGLGLKSIKQRTKDIGGKAEISSWINGTEIKLTIPV